MSIEIGRPMVSSAIRLRLIRVQQSADSLRHDACQIMADGDCPQAIEGDLVDVQQALSDVVGRIELLLERCGWAS
jgi:hypothetical protein